MRKLFSLPSILPKRLGLPGRNSVASGLAQQLASAATCEGDKLVAELGSSPTGLADGEAEKRLEQVGLNAVAQEEGNTYRDLLVKALLNPLVILLSLLAVVSALTGDLRGCCGDGHDGGLGRGAAFRSGGQGGHGSSQAEGHDPGHRHRDP
jgi:hypothetical protein